MARQTKIINVIYDGVFEGMSIDKAEDYFNHAKSLYQDKLEKFNYYNSLYKKAPNKGPYDKNIVFELIESEIDNNIYFPKVRSTNGRTSAALELEHILKSELYDYKYREFNDLQERNTYIFGGAVTLVYWDALSRNSAAGGKLQFKAIDPRNFIPQNGIKRIEDMDYCFIVESTTKMTIANLYQLSNDQLDLLKSDSEFNIDVDLVTVKTMYYKDKYNHICRFTWCGNLVLEDDDNIYCDKSLFCSNCGALKLADEDTCIDCGSSDFELKEIDRKEILVRLMSEIPDASGQNSVTLPKETVVNVTPYVPNRFPIVIRKNISTTDDLFGISDVEMIETSQSLNNSILNKLAERVLKSGSLVALPKTLRNKLKVDNSELKIMYYDTPAEANGIIVKNLQPPFGNETFLMDSAYATARQTLGITNTFQGREDNSAVSSKAKALQVQQTAGRLESKREMKKASLTSFFELCFQFILAYSYEYKGYYVDIDGKEEFKIYDNRLFLVNKDGSYFYDDEYTFDIDLSATLENNREQMWQETRLNFSSGSYGDPNQLQTLKMFWQTMYRLHYPGAKQALDYIEDRLREQLEQQQIEQAYKTRELQLQQSQITSNDIAKQQDASNQANMTNAKILESLKK